MNRCTCCQSPFTSGISYKHTSDVEKPAGFPEAVRSWLKSRKRLHAWLQHWKICPSKTEKSKSAAKQHEEEELRERVRQQRKRVADLHAKNLETRRAIEREKSSKLQRENNLNDNKQKLKDYRQKLRKCFESLHKSNEIREEENRDRVKGKSSVCFSVAESTIDWKKMRREIEKRRKELYRTLLKFINPAIDRTRNRIVFFDKSVWLPLKREKRQKINEIAEQKDENISWEMTTEEDSEWIDIPKSVKFSENEYFAHRRNAAKEKEDHPPEPQVSSPPKALKIIARNSEGPALEWMDIVLALSNLAKLVQWSAMILLDDNATWLGNSEDSTIDSSSESPGDFRGSECLPHTIRHMGCWTLVDKFPLWIPVVRNVHTNKVYTFDPDSPGEVSLPTQCIYIRLGNDVYEVGLADWKRWKSAVGALHRCLQMVIQTSIGKVTCTLERYTHTSEHSEFVHSHEIAPEMALHSLSLSPPRGRERERDYSDQLRSAVASDIFANEEEETADSYAKKKHPETFSSAALGRMESVDDYLYILNDFVELFSSKRMGIYGPRPTIIESS